MIVTRIFQAMFCALGTILLGACFFTAGEIGYDTGDNTTFASWTCTTDTSSSQTCILGNVETDSTSTQILGKAISAGLAGIGSFLVALVIGTGLAPTGAAVPMPAMGPGWGGPPGAYRGPPPPGWAGPTAQSPGPPPTTGAAPGSSGPGT